MWFASIYSCVRDNNGKVIGIQIISYNITDLKKTKEELEESKENFKGFFNSNPSSTFVWEFENNDFVLKEVNEASQKLTNNQAAGFIGMKASEIYKDLPLLIEKLKKCYHSKKTIEFEFNYQNRFHGTYDWISFRFAFLNPNKVILYADSINERKKVQDALKQSEEKYKHLVETASDAIYLMAEDGRIMDTNNSACQMLGRTKDEILKLNIDDIDPNFPLEDFLKFWEKVPYDQQNIFETTHKRKDGSLIPIEISGKKYKIGEETFYYGVARDITERKKAEADLIKAKENAEESELKFRSIYENVPVGIFRSTPSGKVLSANPAFLEIYGFKNLKELQNTPADDFYCESNDRKKMLDGLEKKGIVKNFLTQERKKDGSIIWVESDYRAVKNKKGKIIYIDGNMQDITKRKLIEKELIEAKEKAEESDYLKSTFLANMSHEIRTPMNGIIGFSEMFLKENISKDKRKFYANVVIDSGKQLLKIVDDILDISMIESNTIKLVKDKVIVNNVLMNLFAIFNGQLDSNAIKLQVHKTLNDEQSTIYTDNQRFQQVLTNLINNAIKFTQVGHIKFGYLLKEKNLEFYVEDTGLGIDTNNLDKIFERFTQAEKSTSQVYGGTGLGLSISKHLVELLGGNIWVESKKGKGSKFFFTIPYNPVMLKNSKPESNAKEEKTKYTILVAEDEEVNYLFIEEVLSDLDIQIIPAKNGLETVKICKENPFIDLVLMDLKMPIMDGFEATKKIKEIRPKLPIIAQTAYAMTSDKEKAQKAGCDDYFSKPIDANELIATVKKILNI